jgi:predicted DNA-binding transcriptional regulator AlpA
MSQSNSGEVLAGYISEQQLADQLGVHWRTIYRWRQLGIGPPVTQIGPKKIAYRADAVRDWLMARERKQPRQNKAA